MDVGRLKDGKLLTSRENKIVEDKVIQQWGIRNLTKY